MKRTIVLLIFLSLTAFANSPDKLQAALNQVTTIKADFEQIYTNKNFEEGVKLNGKFLLKKPGKIRWDYQKPEKKVITTDGKTFWLYKAEDKQVYINMQFSEQRKNMGISFLWGDKKLAEVFKVKFIKKENKFYVFELDPKKPMENVQKLTVWANVSDYRIKKVLMLEASGNTNLMTFNKMKFNKSLKDGMFVFVPAKGVEVILQNPPVAGNNKS